MGAAGCLAQSALAVLNEFTAHQRLERPSTGSSLAVSRRYCLRKVCGLYCPGRARSTRAPAVAKCAAAAQPEEKRKETLANQDEVLSGGARDGLSARPRVSKEDLLRLVGGGQAEAHAAGRPCAAGCTRTESTASNNPFVVIGTVKPIARRAFAASTACAPGRRP